MDGGLFLLLLAACAVVVTTLLPWLRNLWRYRHIPGPAPLPFLGNMLPMLRMGMHEYLLVCSKKYGNTFKVFLGSSMMVVTADAEASRRVAYRNINRSMFRAMRTDDDDIINSQGIVAARDEDWRVLRLAWQPAFQSGSLEAYAHIMDRAAVTLANRLGTAADTGEVVDIWRELGRMTLAVVGSAAYGVDFHTLSTGGQQDADAVRGTSLLAACAAVFASGGILSASKWVLLNAMLGAPRVVGWFARHLPDEPLRKLIAARRTIREVSVGLIDTWRQEHAAPPQHDSNIAQGDDATADVVLTRDRTDKALMTSAGATNCTKPAKPAGLGVAPGGFLGLMLKATHKGSGTSLTDNEIIAQANTFTLAGYETTANTLAYAVYNISAHPEVEARLLAEIDAVGHDRVIGYADMSQYPYTEAIVRESLRLYPPATALNRELKADIELAPKMVVPAGTVVLCFLYGYQRSAEYWPKALEFLPERWLPGSDLAPSTPDAWTPFGAGPRMCVGWRFALQEAVTALVRLYQHQVYRLEPGQVPLKVQQNITLVPTHGVQVRVQQRRE